MTLGPFDIPITFFYPNITLDTSGTVDDPNTSDDNESILLQREAITEINDALWLISATPEGQFLLNAAMENDDNLIIDGNISDPNVTKVSINLFGNEPSSLHINWLQISSKGYPVGDGLYQKPSIIRVLVHELAHYKANMNLLFDHGENVAIHFTNEFMAKYFGETPRLPGDMQVMSGEMAQYNELLTSFDHYIFIGALGHGNDSMEDILSRDYYQLYKEAYTDIFGDENGNGANREALGISNNFDSSDWQVLQGIKFGTDAINDTLLLDNDKHSAYGADGADVIVSNAMLKGILDGGDGVDAVSYAQAGEGVNVDLAAGEGAIGTLKTDMLRNIENVTGSDFADTITGDVGDNILSGGKGNDVLTGGGPLRSSGSYVQQCSRMQNSAQTLIYFLHPVVVWAINDHCSQ